MIKVALVDDHELFLEGLKRLLQSLEDLDIVDSYTDGLTLLNNIENIDIDVLLLDLQLPDIDPETLLVKLNEIKPNLPILYLTMMRGNRIFRKLEKHNISGYILKDSSLEELHVAIKKVAGGSTVFSESRYQGKDVQQNTVTIPPNKIKDILSPREKDVLALICREYSSTQIAEKLFVSTSTVDTHRKNMLLKLGVNNTVGLIKYAIKHGIIED